MTTKESKEEAALKPVVGPSGRQIVYDKDGKPCRACNSLLDFKAVKFGEVPPQKIESSTSSETSLSGYARNCPPDVNEIGRSSWTLLHSIAATYPPAPSTQEQQNMLSFIDLFSKIYPCWFCAKDFQNYIAKPETKPKVKTQEEFGRWLCDAHNEVNVKLGKPEFDCNLWKQRWKDGWDDSNCG